jgi:hypothetical protein
MKKVYVLVQENCNNRCISVFEDKDKALEALKIGYQYIVYDSSLDVEKSSIDKNSYAVSTVDGGTEIAYIKEIELNCFKDNWFSVQ